MDTVSFVVIVQAVGNVQVFILICEHKKKIKLSFCKTCHSTVIPSLPLIQKEQLSVSGERMCTVLVNSLED